MKQLIAAILIASAIVFASLQISGKYRIIGRDKVFVTPGTETYVLLNFDDFCIIRIRDEWTTIGEIGIVVKRLNCQTAGAEKDNETPLVIVDLGSSAVVVPTASITPID